MVQTFQPQQCGPGCSTEGQGLPPWMLYQKGRIGILLDFVWYKPSSHNNADQAAAQRARDFHLGWFLDPIIYGRCPYSVLEIVKDRLPTFSDEESRTVKGSMDYVGVNHYTSFYMKDPGAWNLTPVSYQDDWHVGFVYEPNGVPIGAQANSYWLYIVPWGINKLVTYVKKTYGNPTMILSENGGYSRSLGASHCAAARSDQRLRGKNSSRCSAIFPVVFSSTTLALACSSNPESASSRWSEALVRAAASVRASTTSGGSSARKH